MENMKKNISKK